MFGLTSATLIVARLLECRLSVESCPDRRVECDLVSDLPIHVFRALCTLKQPGMHVKRDTLLRYLSRRKIGS